MVSLKSVSFLYFLAPFTMAAGRGQCFSFIFLGGGGGVVLAHFKVTNALHWLYVIKWWLKLFDMTIKLSKKICLKSRVQERGVLSKFVSWDRLDFKELIAVTSLQQQRNNLQNSIAVSLLLIWLLDDWRKKEEREIKRKKRRMIKIRRKKN